MERDWSQGCASGVEEVGSWKTKLANNHSGWKHILDKVKTAPKSQSKGLVLMPRSKKNQNNLGSPGMTKAQKRRLPIHDQSDDQGRTTYTEPSPNLQGLGRR